MTDIEKDNCFSIYLDKLSKGEYRIPPCFIIQEIAKTRYQEENLDIYIENHSGVDTFEDLKEKESFNYLIEDIDDFLETLVNNKDFIWEGLKSELGKTRIIVKYPEITITNSQGNSHLIKDLYLKYEFNREGGLSEYFTMTRSTYTYAELLASYRHSHHRKIGLTTDSLRSWGDTCLGSGPLSTSMHWFVNANLEDFEEARVMQLFSDVDAYLSWESLEGVPFIKISNIIASKKNLSVYTPSSTKPSRQLVKDTLNSLLNDEEFLALFSLIPSVNDNNTPKYQVTYDYKQVLRYVTNLLSDSDYTYFGGKLFIKDDEFGNLKFYLGEDNYTRIQKIDTLSNLYLFRFKGQDVNLTTIKDESGDTEELEEVVNPSYILYLISTIELKINTKNGRSKFDRSRL